MPAYNHEKYVGEAIESVLNQSFTDLELIIINDGSSDRTEKIIKTYDDLRIKYYYQENSGAHNAINRGLSIASGEYISIINSDDVYHPERLNFLIKKATEKKLKFCMTDVELIDSSSVSIEDPLHHWNLWHSRLKEKYLTTGSLALAFVSGNMGVTSSNFFFHRSVMDNLEPFKDYRYVHDYEFVLRVLLRYRENIGFFPDKKYLRYRLHAKNTIKENGVVVSKETLDVLTQLAPCFAHDHHDRELVRSVLEQANFMIETNKVAIKIINFLIRIRRIFFG